MQGSDIANLAVAVDALNERDFEPLVSMMSDDMVWQGARQGPTWWRRPS